MSDLPSFHEHRGQRPYRQKLIPRPCCILNRGPVGVKEEAKMSATFTATRKGKHHIAVSFQSNELTDVHGECTVSEPEAT